MRIALWNGVQPEIIHAIAGRYLQACPVTISDLPLHYRINAQENVCDPTYAAMVKRFGDRGVIEAITLVSPTAVWPWFAAHAATASAI
jgi:hypothetical protein